MILVILKNCSASISPWNYCPVFPLGIHSILILNHVGLDGVEPTLISRAGLCLWPLDCFRKRNITPSELVRQEGICCHPRGEPEAAGGRTTGRRINLKTGKELSMVISFGPWGTLLLKPAPPLSILDTRAKTVHLLLRQFEVFGILRGRLVWFGFDFCHMKHTDPFLIHSISEWFVFIHCPTSDLKDESRLQKIVLKITICN